MPTDGSKGIEKIRILILSRRVVSFLHNTTEKSRRKKEQ